MGRVPHIHFVPDERSVDVGDGITVLRAAIAGRLQCGPEIRLACQTKVSGDVTVRRLVLDPEDNGLMALFGVRR